MTPTGLPQAVQINSKRMVTNMKYYNNTFKGALLAGCAMIAPQTAIAQDEGQGDVEEIVVTGRFIPDEKRATSEISSVVDAAEMSIAGDSDVAVALTRLPGISPDSSGQFVVVRGLNERYTSTLLNGTELPSPDPLKRAVPLDIFPTSLISSVLVQKTYSAEYPGSFGGGVIDIRTKAVPEEAFFEISVGTGYNGISTGKDGLSYNGSGTDWLGFDNGLRELPDIIANNPTLEGFSPEELEAAGQSFPNIWSIDSEPNMPDVDFNLAMGSSWDVGSEGKLGAIFALDYGTKQRNKFGDRISYQASSATDSGLEPDRDFSAAACEEVGAPAEDCGYRSTTWDINLNAFASVGWEINPQNTIKYTSLLLRSSQQQVEIQQGRTNSEDLANFTRLDWKERRVWSNSLDGEHELELFEQPTQLNWFANYTEASRDVPLRRRYTYVFDDRLNVFEMLRRNDSNRTEYGFLDDESYDVGLDIVQGAFIGDMAVDFKAGMSYNEKDRASVYLKYGFDLGAVSNDELRTFIPEIIFGETNVDPNGIVLREFFDPSSAFTAGFENTQAYFQVDAQATDTLRVSAGVRYEDSLQTVNSTNRTTLETIQINQNVEKWLPSATVTWEFAENMQARLGFSETLNRPDSRELAPVFFVREDGRTELGNPNLVPAEIRNFDARFEWYFGQSDVVTIGGFYKEIDNPIEYSIFARGDGEADTIANAETAEIKGIEVEVEKILGTWGDRELFVRANGSWIDSEVVRSEDNFDRITNLVGRLQGQSDWLGNMQVGFQNEEKGERFNVILNYIGDRIYRLGTATRPDLIESLPVELNLLYSRDVSIWGDNPINITLKAKNLLNDSAERTQGTEIAESFEVGRSFSVSFKYSF